MTGDTKDGGPAPVDLTHTVPIDQLIGELEILTYRDGADDIYPAIRADVELHGVVKGICTILDNPQTVTIADPSLLSEVKRHRSDIDYLLCIIDGMKEASGDLLDPEDEVIIYQIRSTLKGGVEW